MKHESQLNIFDKYRIFDLSIIVSLTITGIILLIVLPDESKAFGVFCLVMGALAVVRFKKAGDNYFSLDDWVYKHVYLDSNDRKYSINTLTREYKTPVYGHFESRDQFNTYAVGHLDNKSTAYLIPSNNKGMYHFYTLDQEAKVNHHALLAKYKVVDLDNPTQRQETVRNLFAPKRVYVQPKQSVEPHLPQIQEGSEKSNSSN